MWCDALHHSVEPFEWSVFRIWRPFGLFGFVRNGSYYPSLTSLWVRFDSIWWCFCRVNSTIWISHRLMLPIVRCWLDFCEMHFCRRLSIESGFGKCQDRRPTLHLAIYLALSPYLSLSPSLTRSTTKKTLCKKFEMTKSSSEGSIAIGHFHFYGLSSRRERCF